MNVLRFFKSKTFKAIMKKMKNVDNRNGTPTWQRKLENPKFSEATLLQSFPAKRNMLFRRFLRRLEINSSLKFWSNRTLFNYVARLQRGGVIKTEHLSRWRIYNIPWKAGVYVCSQVKIALFVTIVCICLIR